MKNAAYLQSPSLHQNTIAFTSDDDIWSVDLSGGRACRLTTSKGISRAPFISPDGKHIAYLSNDHGQFDVYLIAIEGGISERLTYCSAITISGWKDARTLIVSTSKDAFHLRHKELFELNIESKELKPLNLGPATTLHKHGRMYLLGKNLGDPARWKRYRGGTAGTLWLDKTGNKNFVQILKNFKTNLAWPCFIGERIFFISDHEGVGNIYSCPTSGRSVRRHTNQAEYYVRSFSHHGDTIVYQAGADIWTLDLKSGIEKKLEIDIHSSFNQAIERFEPPLRYLQSMDVANEGNKVALCTRGQLFIMPPWSGAPVRIGDIHARYKMATFIDDGEAIMTVEQTEEKEESLMIYDLQDKTLEYVFEKQDWGKIVEMVSNPEKDLVAITNNRNELFICDYDKETVTKVDESRHHYLHDLTWSPKGRFLAYVANEDSQRKGIKVYDCKKKTTRFLLHTVLMDFSPSFSPCGNYLYFIGIREFHPMYNESHFDLGFPNATRPYAVSLRKEVPVVFDTYLDFESDDNEDAGSDGGSAQKKNAVRKKTKKAKTRKKEDTDKDIDFEGIDSRIHGLPVSLGGYESVHACQDKVLFVRAKDRTNDPYKPGNLPASLMIYDLKEKKVEDFQKDIANLKVTSDTKHILMETMDDLRVVTTETRPTDNEGSYNRKDGFIDINRIKVKVHPRVEWRQMYQEAWVLQREHFWDKEMSKIEWENIYIRYLPLLDKVHTRVEFSDLMWEMQGELGTSHCYEMYGDYHRKAPNEQNGTLGAKFNWDESKSAYKITDIYQGDSWIKELFSPLCVPTVQLKPGDYIYAIDGQEFDSSSSMDELLEGKANRKIQLTIQRNGSTKKEDVTVMTRFSDHGVLYRQWVDKNKEYVHKKSSGKLGYVHIPNMHVWGYSEFYRNFLSECNREGLIVDVRYNGGGHVSQHILKILAQKLVGFDKTRWMDKEPYPAYAINGPIVCVTNEHAGSDGDIFSHCFKLMNIGTLIGKRTWGGVVGIWPRHDLNDGSWTSQPEFSFWFKDTGFDVENYGTDPDIEVEITPKDWSRGIDTQLEKAIEVALKQHKKNPPLVPDFKKRPNLNIPRLPMQ